LLGRRKLTSIFSRTQQSPWAPKGFVMLVAASNPSLVTKPSQGLANLTLTWPERYPYHDFATLIKSRSRVKLAGFEVVISDLEMELDYPRRETRYLEE
jgi:hypothetical protein